LHGVVGQDHLVGSGKPIAEALRTGRVQSMILWGPPGVGKTTLGHLLARAGAGHHVTLSAVMQGMPAFRAALDEAGERATRGQRTHLFIDEIHRCGAAHQAALLTAVRTPHIVVIGTTTENPSFALKGALLARMHVHVLEPLGDAALRRLLAGAQALAPVPLDARAIDRVAQLADGDARRSLHYLEQLWAAAAADGAMLVDAAFVERTLAPPARRFDKRGEAFYDQISALHKSVRGSHPDAALYWLTRMLDGGVDPQYLVRRMLAMAWDDIGLADPRAVHIVLHAAASYERLGAAEGNLALAQAAVYLAVADKSNAGAMAFSAAMAYVRSQPPLPVPAHLRGQRRAG
jgi:putative ATPase